MNNVFYHVQSDKTFLEVLFSSKIEVFFSNVNGVIRAISSLFIYFLRKISYRKKAQKHT